MDDFSKDSANATKCDELLRAYGDSCNWRGPVESVDEKDHPEKRWLGLGNHSLVLLGSKSKPLTVHYLELTEIYHPDENQVVISIDKKRPVGLRGENVHSIVQALLNNYARVFFGLPFSMQFTKRIRTDLMPDTSRRPVKRLDGLSDLYRAFCSKFGTRFREDIAWDIDNVLSVNGVTAFDPREFELPTEAADLRPLLKAVQFNDAVTSLHLVKMKGKIDRDVAQAAAEVFSTNTSITSLVMFDCGPTISQTFLPAFATSISTNVHSALCSISIQNHALDDKDIVCLANGIGGMAHGLVMLNLSDNEFGKKGTKALVQALQRNPLNYQSLLKLNLSYNKIDPEGCVSLGTWLANPNQLEELHLTDVNGNIQALAASLSRGSQNGLRVFDVALNKFAKGPPSVSDLSSLLAGAPNLRVVNIAGTQPTVAQLKDLLRALCSNPVVEGLELNISSNALGVVGANLLALEIGQAKCISKLICGDNGFGDKGLSILCDALRGNSSLTSLDLSDNFDAAGFRKQKQASMFIESLGELVLHSQCALRELRIASKEKNSQARHELLPFLVDLGACTCLLSLDISGQGLEYSGMVAISKMLQLNKSIVKLQIDGNGLDLQGLRALEQGVSRNSTIQELPLPVEDVTNLLSKLDFVSRADFSTYWGTIETVLHRNRDVSGLMERREGLRRAGNVMRAARTLFDDDIELDKLRWAVRVATGTNEAAVLTDEQRVLVGDVDNLPQSEVLLANIRSRVLLEVTNTMHSELQNVVPPVLACVETAKKQLREELFQSLAKSFPSLSAWLPKLEDHLDRTDKAVTINDVELAFKQNAADDILARLDQAMDSELKCAGELVRDMLFRKMQNLVNELTGGEQVALRSGLTQPGGLAVPRADGAALAPDSPRTGLPRKSLGVAALSSGSDLSPRGKMESPRAGGVAAAAIASSNASPRGSGGGLAIPAMPALAMQKIQTTNALSQSGTVPSTSPRKASLAASGVSIPMSQSATIPSKSAPGSRIGATPSPVASSPAPSSAETPEKKPSHTRSKSTAGGSTKISRRSKDPSSDPTALTHIRRSSGSVLANALASPLAIEMMNEDQQAPLPTAVLGSGPSAPAPSPSATTVSSNVSSSAPSPAPSGGVVGVAPSLNVVKVPSVEVHSPPKVVTKVITRRVHRRPRGPSQLALPVDLHHAQEQDRRHDMFDAKDDIDKFDHL